MKNIPKTLSRKHGSVRKIALNERKLILKSIPPHIFLLIRMMGWEDPGLWIHPITSSEKNISPTRNGPQSHPVPHIFPSEPPSSTTKGRSLQSSWKAQHSFEDFPGICPGLGFYQKHVFENLHRRGGEIYGPSMIHPAIDMSACSSDKTFLRAYINLHSRCVILGETCETVTEQFYELMSYFMEFIDHS